MSADPVHQAAQAIRAGKIVAYPTEAVFGLGCDPLNESAVRKLLVMKKRAWEKGLILIAARMSQIESFMAPLDEAVRQCIMATWPGPVTWLAPAADHISELLRGDHETIALRVTAHPIAATLCLQADTAIVSTSANIAGAPPARSACEVQQMFETQVDFILDGPVDMSARPTEIRDALTGKRIRA